jgi:hypothetical protein
LSLIELEDGIGEMTSLQTLNVVDLDAAAKIIKGLGKLKQMRTFVVQKMESFYLRQPMKWNTWKS